MNLTNCGETIYCIDQVASFDHLKSLITSKLDELDFNSRCSQLFSTFGNELKAEERKSKEITKKLTEGASILEDLMKDLQADGDDENDELQSVSSISIIDEDDGDIMLVDSGVDSVASMGLRSPMVAQQYGQSYILVNENGHQIHAVMGPVNTQNSQTHGLEGGGTPYSSRLPMILPRTMTVLNQPSPKPPELAVGMKLYAKKHNEIWYKGALIEIQNRDRPFSERKFKVKFDGKGMRVVGSKFIAYSNGPKDNLLVGSRIIALYKDEEYASQSYYAGIIAEPPSLRNNNRYLVFFDDGYAQYSISSNLHLVCDQSKQVWEDIHPDSQEFIKGYLQQYPERPMVRMHPGQVIKTEWKGSWLLARVQEVDASLVKMYFESDKRVEWIYRGSTRLEPLYTELANAEASKQLGKGRRRGGNTNNPKNSKKPFVEYTRNVEEPDPKKLASSQMQNQMDNQMSRLDQSFDLPRPAKAVAKKTTSKPPITPSPEPIKQLTYAIPCEDSQSSSNHSMRADKRTPNSRGNEAADGAGEGPLGALLAIDRHQFVRPESLHRGKMPLHCYPTCLRDINDDPTAYKLRNPLLIPLFYGWERQLCKQRNSLKRSICYRTPCGRSIRNLVDVDRYLIETNSKMTIDLFCFDSGLRIDVEYIPVKTFCDIKDLSYGKENVPISCVNGIDRQYPDYVEYSNQRIPAKGVQLVLDSEFLVGCDCTDGCRDRSKCRCIQMTLEATTWSSGGYDDQAGYKYRRLKEPLLTGIFECNSKCKCDSRCHNRVVQHGLTLRLQVFKTERRGWGLRCLDDIPAGGFICIYAGQLLTDEGANEDGQQYGDEYLAELDYIETVEKTKEGYESDVCISDNSNSPNDLSSSESNNDQRDSDSTYSGERRLNRRKKGKKRTRGRRQSAKDAAKPQSKPWPDKTTTEVASQQEKTQEWLDKMPIMISDDELDDKDTDLPMETDVSSGTGKQSDSKSGKLDETTSGKLDETTSGKLDETTSGKLDDVTSGKLDDATCGKLDDATSGKLDDATSGKLDEIKSGKLDETKCGKVDDATSGKPDETKSGKVDDTSSGKIDDSKIDDAKIEKMDDSSEMKPPKVDDLGPADESSQLDHDYSKLEIKDSKDAKEAEVDAAVIKTVDDEKAADQTVKPDDESSLLLITDPTSLNVDDVDMDSDDCDEGASNNDKSVQLQEISIKIKRTTRSQTSLFHKLPDPKSQKPANLEKSQQKAHARKGDGKSNEKAFVRTRHLFGEEFSYTMDAKSMGNLGRYLNHSCTPNAFVQSVFVDTHDLRFPWVAFFALEFIRAGTELTWDYNYGVGSVPGKILYCYCGSAECRGRLL